MAPYRAGLGVHSDQRTHARPVLAGILSGIAALVVTVACIAGLEGAGGWLLLPLSVATSCAAGFALGHLIRFLARRRVEMKPDAHERE